MYLSKPHQQQDLKKIQHLIQLHPLATVVSFENGELNANHIPLLWKENDSEFGILQGHVARPNSLWQAHDPGIDALAVFTAADTYISPELSISKAEDGKVVPTWSYMVAHASGPLKIIDDPDWMEQHLTALTKQHEADRKQPWTMNDAPRKFINAMKKGIVGIEIDITQLLGKWKLNQKESQRNKDSISVGLSNSTRQSDMRLCSFIQSEPEKN
ncbi:MAG: FMN-binding negative transcriptional regulator [Arenicella sp.]